jgi:hypothetical protein
MPALNLKPTGAAVKRYYATLERFARDHFDKEGNIRGAFEDLLKQCARQFEWTVVPETAHLSPPFNVVNPAPKQSYSSQQHNFAAYYPQLRHNSNR